MDDTPTAQRVDERLAELRAEYERGTAMLADLEAQVADTRDQLLRIAGAIRVLEELTDDVQSGNADTSS